MRCFVQFMRLFKSREMTMHEYLDDDDLLSEIVGDEESPPITRLVKSDFQPWHLPRKQFVRIKQWVQLLDRNKKKILDGGDRLKYLSLPGDDLLDLRVIHDNFCIKNKVKLNFLGFNRFPNDTSHPRHYDINLSLVEVKEKDLVDNESQIINYDINQIGLKGSPANVEARKHAPFDVINLDFCDSIFNTKEAGHNTHDLLNEMLFIQSSKRSPWLMFVTTRIGEKFCDKQIISKLMQCFKENLTHIEFSNAAKEKLGIIDIDDFEESMSEHDKHANITLISLLKWLLTRCFSYNPKCKIDLSSTMSYMVEKDSAGFDMVSFALLFTPVVDIPVDRFDLVTNNCSESELTEPTLAVNFIDRILTRKDCDAILSSDEGLQENMINQTIALLLKARYDTNNYRAWVKSHFSSSAC